MDEQIRPAAFKWLEEQALINGDVLPRTLLEKGFLFNGQRITLVEPQGIWKPKIMELIPLSITTVSGGPYDDSFTNDSFLIYRYRGTDPNHRDNVGLREAMKRQVPLIYSRYSERQVSRCVACVCDTRRSGKPDVYRAADDPAALGYIFNGSLPMDESIYFQRRYITLNIKQRLHQKTFRERVLEAYNRQCAFCRLRHTELLDAVHII